MSNDYDVRLIHDCLPFFKKLAQLSLLLLPGLPLYVTLAERNFGGFLISLPFALVAVLLTSTPHFIGYLFATIASERSWFSFLDVLAYAFVLAGAVALAFVFSFTLDFRW